MLFHLHLALSSLLVSMFSVMLSQTQGSEMSQMVFTMPLLYTEQYTNTQGTHLLTKTEYMLLCFDVVQTDCGKTPYILCRKTHNRLNFANSTCRDRDMSQNM